MLIRRVSVQDFGCLTATTDVEFGPGLNVIHGPNEIGKTTLFRAIRYALTIKSTVTGSFFNDIKPRSGGHPEVELVFEHDRTTFTLKKRFQKQSGTTNLQLSSSSGTMEQLAGEEAEDRLRELLGVEATQRTRRGSEHLGIWPLLWVEQGQSGDVPTDHLTDSGRAALDTQLSELSGEVLAGGSGECLIELAKTEYDDFYTSSGQESSRADSPLKQARDRMDDAATALDELESREKEHAAAVDQYIRTTASIAEIDEQLPALKTKALEAKKTLEQLEVSQRQFEKLEAELRTSEVEQQRAQERVNTRKKLRLELEAIAKELLDATLRLEGARDAEKEHAGKRSELADALTQSESHTKTSDRLQRRAAAHVEVLRLRGKIKELQSSLSKATGLRAKIIAADVQLETLAVTAALVKKLTTLERQVREDELALEAAAASIEVTALLDTEVEINGDSENLKADATKKLYATESTDVRIGDMASIRITPGGDEIVERRKDAQKSTQKLQKALQDADVESAEDAAEQLETKRQIDSEHKQNENLLEVHAPDGVDALEAQVGVVDEKLKQAELTLKGSSESSDDSLPDDADSAQNVLNDLNDMADEARRAVDDARKRLAVHDSKQQQLEADRRVAEQGAKEQEKQQQKLEAALAKSVEEHGDDEVLGKTLTDAKQTYSTQKEKVDGLEAELDELQPKTIVNEAQNSQQAVDNAGQERDDLRTAQIRLEAELSAGDLAGLHERIDRANAKLDAATEDVGRQTRRAHAAKLLYETLRACRDEVRSRYLAPLEKEVAKLLPMLFPNAKIDFDEQFKLTQVNRRSVGADGFDELSGGSQEQVGVVVRLAMAMVLAGDQPLVVMLDDALVSTDDERYARMGAVLARCTDKLQLLVATCHWNRYRRLGVPINQVTDLSEKRRVAAAS